MNTGYGGNVDPFGNVMRDWALMENIFRGRRAEQIERQKLDLERLNAERNYEISREAANRAQETHRNALASDRLGADWALYKENLLSPEQEADYLQKVNMQKPQAVAEYPYYPPDVPAVSKQPTDPAWQDLRESAGLPRTAAVAGEPHIGLYKEAMQSPDPMVGPAYTRDKALLDSALAKVDTGELQTRDEAKVVSREFVNNPAFIERNPGLHHVAVEEFLRSSEEFRRVIASAKGDFTITRESHPDLFRIFNAAFPMIGRGSNLKDAAADKILVRKSPDGNPDNAKIVVGISGTDPEKNVRKDGVLTRFRSSDPRDQIVEMSTKEWTDMAAFKEKVYKATLAAREALGDKEAAKLLNNAYQNKVIAQSVMGALEDMHPQEEGYKQMKGIAESLLADPEVDGTSLITRIVSTIPKETFWSQMKKYDAQLAIQLVKDENAMARTEYSADRREALVGKQLDNALQRTLIQTGAMMDRLDKRDEKNKEKDRYDKQFDASKAALAEQGKAVRTAASMKDTDPKTYEDAVEDLLSMTKEHNAKFKDNQNPQNILGKPTPRALRDQQEQPLVDAYTEKLKQKFIEKEQVKTPKPPAVPQKQQAAAKAPPKGEFLGEERKYTKEFDKQVTQREIAKKQKVKADNPNKRVSAWWVENGKKTQGDTFNGKKLTMADVYVADDGEYWVQKKK